MPLSGRTIELRGYMKQEDVSDYSGFWMRQDGQTPNLAFVSMQNRQINGTRDWGQHSITFNIHPDARVLFFGFLMGGTGKAWADDLELLVDGKPFTESILDQDREFDTGSGITVTGLTAVQIDNLAVLAKVWGFLKYHHLRITSGGLQWDYELMRVLPKILAAGDRSAASDALVQMISGLGTVEACTRCASLNTDNLHLAPALEWISNEDLLDAGLSRQLREIHANRPSANRQFHLMTAPGVGNPVFDRELSYERVRFPDFGFQLLALYRFWNMIEYWFPYRDVIGEGWDSVLRRFLPRIALAASFNDYQLEMMALIANVHDTHANLWSSISVRPPSGPCQLPVVVRFIENRAAVTGYSDQTGGPATGLKVGDIISTLDGAAVSQLVERWTPYYAASNDPTRLRDIARYLTRGACGDTALKVERENETLDLKAQRRTTTTQDLLASATHDLPGDAFRLLSSDVAYLKLSSVRSSDVNRYISGAAGTKGMIIDIRNYPSEFVVFTLGQRLIDGPVQFVRFTTGDPSNPGAFQWTQPLLLNPQQPSYSGKIVILIDEVTQSQAEYTTMAFRTSPRAVVLGSTTAGADGNVSAIALPGRLSSLISGIGVFYPDKSPTQRIGIVPDIEVKPTIAGIRAGMDELMAAGIRQILGPDVTDGQIKEMLGR